jgi:hypothetical protein
MKKTEGQKSRDTVPLIDIARVYRAFYRDENVYSLIPVHLQNIGQ